MSRTVVVGASTGLGRCIGIGLAQRGANVALLARRLAKVRSAAEEAGNGAVAVQCDVTDEESCGKAIAEAAERLGGIDVLLYAAAVGTLQALSDTDAATWRATLDTNVMGASLATAAALPHLQASSGIAMYLSTISASLTPPWPGLGAYAVSKAALDKLIEAWRAEHDDVAFTRVIIGNCSGGNGDAQSHFSEGWDPDVRARFGPTWVARNYVSGTVMDVDEAIDAIDAVLRGGASLAVPSITLMPRGLL